MKLLPLVFAVLLGGSVLVLRRQLGRVLTLVGLAAVALLVVYGLGLVELPKLEDVIEDVGTTLGAWTYLLVALLAFFEAAAFIGLVAPGEFAVVFGGIIAGRGDIDLVLLIAIVWFAAVAGDVASYAFGRKVGRGWALRHGDRFGVTEKRLAWAEGYFASHGGKTIVVGRFVGIVRALAPFIAGTSHMPFRRFLLADIVGAGLWAATFSILGYIFWRSLDRALELARDGKLGFFALLGLVALCVGIYQALGNAEHRARTRAWLRENAPFAARRGKARPATVPEPDERRPSVDDETR